MTEAMREQFEAEAVKAFHNAYREARMGSPRRAGATYAAVQAVIALTLRSPAVAGLVEALRAAQWDCHGKCPVCAGFMVGPNGETRHAHTPECPVGTALAQYATLAGEKA
jgi:hypothetical protein